MSSHHRILQNDSLLSRLDRLYFRLESFLNLAGGLVILALVLLATINVLGRWIFDSPINGYIDWIEQAMAFMAFLGIAYTQREGGHIRMDMVVGQLQGRSLWLAEFLSTLLMLLLTLVLTWGSWLHAQRALQLGDSSLDIDLPTWPAKMVVPIALGVLALRLMLQLWGYARALHKGDDEPIAVPLVEDAATVAAREAESAGNDTTEKYSRS